MPSPEYTKHQSWQRPASIGFLGATSETVWAAFVAPAEEVGGRYCEDCQVSPVTEGLISPVSPGVRPYALDPEHAKALWAKSEEMVGERF